MIKFRCKYCEQKLGVPDQWIGHDVRCPRCKQALPVPSVTDVQLENKPVIAEKKPAGATTGPTAAKAVAAPAKAASAQKKAAPVKSGSAPPAKAATVARQPAVVKSKPAPQPPTPVAVKRVARKPPQPATVQPVQRPPAPGKSEPIVTQAPPADYTVFSRSAAPPEAPTGTPAPPATPPVRSLVPATRPAASPKSEAPPAPRPSLSAIVGELHLPGEPGLTATKAVADLLQGLAPPPAYQPPPIKPSAGEPAAMTDAARALGALALLAGAAGLTLCLLPAFTKFALPAGIAGLMLAILAVIVRTTSPGLITAAAGGCVCSTGIVLAVLVSCGVLPGATPHSTGNYRAGTLIARGQNVQVRVTSASVVRPAVHAGQWKTLKTNDQPFLQVTLEIRPLLRQGEITYRSWGRVHDGMEPPSLTDNEGNPLKLVEVSPLVPAGRPRDPTRVAAAQKGISDVLLFEIPPASAQELELQLPGGNVGAEGTLEFKIPAGMLRR